MDNCTDGTTKVLHEDLSLLDLSRVDLTADHWTEGDAWAELLADSQSKRSLASTGRASQEEASASHLACLDQIDNDAARLRLVSHHHRLVVYLACCLLSCKATCYCLCCAILTKAEAV